MWASLSVWNQCKKTLIRKFAPLCEWVMKLSAAKMPFTANAGQTYQTHQSHISLSLGVFVCVIVGMSVCLCTVCVNECQWCCLSYVLHLCLSRCTSRRSPFKKSWPCIDFFSFCIHVSHENASKAHYGLMRFRTDTWRISFPFVCAGAVTCFRHVRPREKGGSDWITCRSLTHSCSQHVSEFCTVYFYRWVLLLE